MDLKEALTNIAGEAIASKTSPDVEWAKLTPGELRDALRSAVRAAQESAVSEQTLAQCWELARNAACLVAIERAQTRPNIDCIRLYRNLACLISTAAAAAAAMRAVNVVGPDRTAPARVRQWLQRAVQSLYEDVKSGDLEETSPTNWIFDSAESVIEAACSELAASGWRMGTVRHWARHWLSDSHAPVMIVPLAVKDMGANRGCMLDLRLERIPGDELIEHYDASLQPADRVLLDTLREAQQSAGIGAAWSITKRGGGSVWEMALEGGSLGLAAYTAFRLLKEGRPFDHSCLLVGQILGGVIERVKGEDVKLEAALQTGIRRVGIAPLADIQNKNVYPQLDVQTMHTIEEAANFASGLIEQVERILKGEIAKVVAEAGSRMGRHRRPASDSDALVQSWEDLKHLHVPVRVALGIRPFLRDEELRELEQRRAQGDYSGQNRVEQERFDLREKELQESLPTEKRRQTVEWESVRKRVNQAVVTGDPGYGKSMLSWLEMEENLNALERLKTREQSIYEIAFSIWMPAARLAERVGHQSAIEAIVEILSRTHTLEEDGQGWLREQLYKGHARIVLDALDEVPETSREQLNRALAEIPQDMRILLTSRLLGYAGAPFSVRKEDEVEILAFDDDQMEQSIRLWFGEGERRSDPAQSTSQQADNETADALWTHIQEHWMVREILHCPLLLRLACESADRLRQEHRKLPKWETRTELYETFLDHAIHRFVQKKRAGAEVEGSLRRFASDLSLELWIQDSRRTFWGTEQLADVVAKLRPTYPAFASRDVLEDLKAADILVPSATEEHRRPPLMYTHRSIGEYLVARALAQKLRQKDAREWVLVDKKAWDPQSRPVLLFLAGLLVAQPALERYVALCRNPETDPYEDDLFQHRLCLATEVLAELPAITRARLGDQVNGITQAIFDRYWEALTHAALSGAIAHLKPAWRAAGHLNGFVGKRPLLSELMYRFHRQDWTAKEALSHLGVALASNSVVMTQLLNAVTDPESVNRWAGWILESLGPGAALDPRTIPRLLDGLHHENPGVKIRSIKVLSRLGTAGTHDGRVISSLLEVVLSTPIQSSEVRSDAIVALGALGKFASDDSDVIKTLVEFISNPERPLEERHAAACAVGTLGARAARDERVIPALLNMLCQDCHESESALMGLLLMNEALPRDVRFVDSLLRPLRHSRDARNGALILMRALPETALNRSAVITVLFEYFSDDDWIGRRSIANLLGSTARHNPDLISALLVRLEDPDTRVRETAAHALRAVGDAAADNCLVIPALVRRLWDAEACVRETAAVALGDMGAAAAQDRQVVSSLLDLVTDPAEHVRASVAKALGHLGATAARDRQIISSLLDLLTDPADHVRANAAEALGHVGEILPGDCEIVTALLFRLADSGMIVRRDVAAAIGRMGATAARDSRVLPALLHGLEDPDREVRENAFEAIGRMGAIRERDSRVIPALLRGLEDPNSMVRRDFSRALGIMESLGVRIFSVFRAQQINVRWVEDLSECDL